MTLPEIKFDDNCLYLTQDLSGMDLYEKSKAIVDFCNKETKLFEKEIDRVLLRVFERNGINISSTDKSVLKQALDTLKRNNIELEIFDLYQDYRVFPNIEFVKETKNHFIVVLEDNKYIQCGVQIQENRL